MMQLEGKEFDEDAFLVFNVVKQCLVAYPNWRFSEIKDELQNWQVTTILEKYGTYYLVI